MERARAEGDWEGAGWVMEAAGKVEGGWAVGGRAAAAATATGGWGWVAVGCKGKVTHKAVRYSSKQRTA